MEIRQTRQITMRNVTGIAQDKQSIRMTRSRFIQLKYCKGLTMAIYRSNTKLHRLITEAYTNGHLTKSIPSAKKAWELQPVANSQKNSEGTALSPTNKSATASETTNALVLVRSWRLLRTRKIINPFPVIATMDRNQLKIQNQVFILN